jgi:hypothetical protein
MISLLLSYIILKLLKKFFYAICCLILKEADITNHVINVVDLD